MGKLTNEQFIKRAKEIHGDKYDYSKVEYKRSDEKVCIICPIHGEFWQRPSFHISYSNGCPICKAESKKKLVYGIGINDLLNESRTKANQIWSDIIRRCYTKEMQDRFPTYKGCTICDEWRYFSNFKRWFDEHYIDGWQIDKDILFKGNKVYSPNTCCFVPNDINTVLIKPANSKCIFRGVTFDYVNNKYMARISILGKAKNLGRYNTAKEAYIVYKQAKEKYIKFLADKWKSHLEPRVYDALYNYKIEITD